MGRFPVKKLHMLCYNDCFFFLFFFFSLLLCEIYRQEPLLLLFLPLCIVYHCVQQSCLNSLVSPSPTTRSATWLASTSSLLSARAYLCPSVTRLSSAALSVDDDGHARSCLLVATGCAELACDDDGIDVDAFVPCEAGILTNY